MPGVHGKLGRLDVLVRVVLCGMRGAERPLFIGRLSTGFADGRAGCKVAVAILVEVNQGKDSGTGEDHQNEGQGDDLRTGLRFSAE